MLIRPSVTESEGPLAGLDWPYKHEVMGNGIYSSLRFQSSETHQRQQHNCQMLSLGQTEKFTFSGKIFIQRNLAWTWQSCSATHWWDRTKNVKYHEGVGGIGLRWPLDSAAEDKGCGHKGPGRRSSRACVLQLRGERYESLYVSQMYALCIEQLKLMKSLTSGAQLLIGCGKTSLITTVKLFSCTVPRCAHQYGGKSS